MMTESKTDIRRLLARSLGMVCGAMTLITVGPAASQSEFPQPVPSECAALAQRHGVGPVVENRAQARAAEGKLKALPASEDGVLQCRATVARLKAQYRAQLRTHVIETVKGWMPKLRRAE
jgi:hypothetical protein